MRYDVSVHGGFIHRKYGDRYDHKLIISWHLEREREIARFRQPTINISISRSLTPVSILTFFHFKHTYKRRKKILMWLGKIRILTAHFDDFQMCLWHFWFLPYAFNFPFWLLHSTIIRWDFIATKLVNSFNDYGRKKLFSYSINHFY